MKTIIIWEKTITLDLWDELKVKDLRKIQPIIAKQKEWEEAEMLLELVKVLWWDVDLIDNMNIKEFTEFSTKFAELIDVTKEDKKKII
jgi:hypothetical protein